MLGSETGQAGVCNIHRAMNEANAHLHATACPRRVRHTFCKIEINDKDHCQSYMTVVYMLHGKAEC